jgi:hypothetical protein
MAVSPYAWLVKLARNKQFRKWLVALGPVATKAFADFLGRMRNREAGIRQAHEIEGQFSIATIDGNQHVIVWKNGKPFSAFPPIEGDIEAKLEHYNRDLLKRPEDLARHKARRWVNQRSGGTVTTPTDAPESSSAPRPPELPGAQKRS